MHLFDTLPAILSGKVGICFCLESGDPDYVQ